MYRTELEPALVEYTHEDLTDAAANEWPHFSTRRVAKIGLARLSLKTSPEQDKRTAIKITELEGLLEELKPELDTIRKELKIANSSKNPTLRYKTLAAYYNYLEK